MVRITGELEERLQQYLEGKLEPHDVLKIEIEIARSADLSVYVSRLRAVNSAIGLVGRRHIDEVLPDEIVSVIDDAMGPGERVDTAGLQKV